MWRLPEAQLIKALALLECGQPPENVMSQEIKLKQKAVHYLWSLIQTPPHPSQFEQLTQMETTNQFR